MVQCPSWDVTPWSFTLPKQLDPNHQPIFLSVSLDSTFFSFDKNTTTIHQISIAEKPVNKTIYITLTSEYGLTETYALFVRFVCNKTESNSFNFTWYPEFQVPTDPKQSPTAKISRIEPSGLVRIQFSQRMKVPYNAPVIQNETVFFNRSVYPIIGFELIPGKYSDSLMTKFTWTYLSFTS